MKSPIKIVAALIVLVLPFSCIDEINLKVDNIEEKIIIEGLIADSLDTYYINVKQTKNKGIYPISNAIVQVLDDRGNSIDFKESTINEGSYEAIMAALPGRNYFTRIAIDGKIYESKPSSLIPSPAIYNPGHIIDTRVYINESGSQVSETVVQVKLDVQFNPSSPKPYLRWRTKGEYEFHEEKPRSAKWCYVKDINDYNKLALYDPRLNNSNSLTNQVINYTELDGRFAILYCFNIYQYTMTRDEYNYWSSIQDLIENKGTLYDPPVGNIQGNLFNKNDAQEQVIGYFSVSGVKSTRYFLSGNSLGGFFPGFPCGNFFNRPAICNDCLTIKFSSTAKPVYWP